MAKGKKTGGRKRGVVNIITADVKAMVLDSLDQVGGVEYLKARSADQPVAYMQLIGKVLPLQLTGKDGTPLAAPILNINIDK